MKLLDVQDEFYRPLWIRLLITVFCFAWAGFEFTSGSPFWGVLFAGLGCYCAYQFFVVFDPPE